MERLTAQIHSRLAARTPSHITEVYPPGLPTVAILSLRPNLLLTRLINRAPPSIEWTSIKYKLPHGLNLII